MPIRFNLDSVSTQNYILSFILGHLSVLREVTTTSIILSCNRVVGHCVVPV